MYDANNMYLQGEPSERKWLTPMGRIKQKLAGLVMPNCNQFPQKGERFELPIHHREFKLDLAAKNLKPVDFSHLRDASDQEILSAVKWIEEKVGWFHSIDLRNSMKTPGHRGW